MAGINSLLSPPTQATAYPGKDRQRPPSRGSPRPSGSFAGVSAQPGSGQRQAGWPESWRGDRRAHCCRAGGLVGWVLPSSRGEPQEALGRGLGAAARHLQPRSPSHLSR